MSGGGDCLSFSGFPQTSVSGREDGDGLGKEKRSAELAAMKLFIYSRGVSCTKKRWKMNKQKSRHLWSNLKTN